MDRYVVLSEGETLDFIVSGYYGSSFGYLELVLKANIFLYRKGIFLEQGTVIYLPKISPEPKKRIKLA